MKASVTSACKNYLGKNKRHRHVGTFPTQRPFEGFLLHVNSRDNVQTLHYILSLSRAIYIYE